MMKQTWEVVTVKPNLAGMSHESNELVCAEKCTLHDGGLVFTNHRDDPVGDEVVICFAGGRWKEFRTVLEKPEEVEP